MQTPHSVFFVLINSATSTSPKPMSRSYASGEESTGKLGTSNSASRTSSYVSHVPLSFVAFSINELHRITKPFLDLTSSFRFATVLCSEILTPARSQLSTKVTFTIVRKSILGSSFFENELHVAINLEGSQNGEITFPFASRRHHSIVSRGWYRRQVTRAADNKPSFDCKALQESII
ncbi:unnamed protein product [Phytophthora lilii]|uniref:Unnamed protein product n=1 Tax=Phytophthora lilii TaxID=2077276 RepID=A0A9W6XED2_9STRA|nr:unnamed protein product [Phytophthora lilii]